ncbi:MAG: hypothetical protein M3418_07760 [Gemmatimonadota bacterium]|nr:hypothetical protein [Gemmatimonadota bacterium]
MGGELEQYLRLLQINGQGEPYPWSIRSFSPGEVDRLLPSEGTHPWAQRYPLARDTSGGLKLDWVGPSAQLIFNSTFPDGYNDGAIWAGRGVTTAFQAGFSARYGPVSLTLAPIVFYAANRAFPLADNGHEGPAAFADGRLPGAIDLPQRFGEQAYARIDPGGSTVRIDAGPIAVGVSTASQHWGPASEHPILLGGNAPGFLHGFLGTSTPLNAWLGTVHGRLVWGTLEQSEFSLVEGRETRRFMSGAVGVFVPRGLPGLELGAARFFHTPWPQGGITADRFLKPLEGLYKKSLRDTDEGFDAKSDLDNQLASVFWRWVFPQNGFEVYGEYGREDHSWDLRDFILEPDHSGAYMLGFRKLWRGSPSRFAALRGEVLNARISHIARVRHQAPFYVHAAGARQGHTHRGQILGSAAGYGGAGAVLGADLYHPGGRWTVEWSRILRQDGATPGADDVLDSSGLDVVQSLGVEAVIFRGGWDIVSGIRGSYNFNRDFGSDATNLNVRLGVRRGL